VISFTVETDGTLPTGPPLAEASEHVDAATDRGPAYYMVNCAHPTHVEPALAHEGTWAERLRGLRANASSKSHAELDESPELDRGDLPQLSREYRSILDRFPHVNVLGGCCGTDHQHVQAIAQACVRR
jgi:S-methylmethionine-dependent homocysteine/selenocysteine methylase